MKLYTEEQLTKYLLDEGIMELFDLENNLVPHIELPSDEEIEDNKFPLNSPEQELYNDGWEEGAKWMRDKIQGGNK
jgi:hypothetical protein